MRILAVDDDKVSRMVFGAYLSNVIDKRGMGYSFEMAESGMEALRKCVAERFDLIFMDVMMPEMDGLEAVKAIGQIYKSRGWKEAFIVMVTACENKRMEARDTGAVGYLLKPVRQCQVLDWIQLAMFGGKNGENVGEPGNIGRQG